MAGHERDFIELTGLRFSGLHGALDEEWQTPQEFLVDIRLYADLGSASATDDLRRTIDYSNVYALARAVLEGPSVHLIETLAGRLAEQLLSRFPADAVRTRVTKLRAPVAPGIHVPATASVFRERRDVSSQRESN